MKVGDWWHKSSLVAYSLYYGRFPREASHTAVCRAPANVTRATVSLRRQNPTGRILRSCWCIILNRKATVTNSESARSTWSYFVYTFDERWRGFVPWSQMRWGTALPNLPQTSAGCSVQGPARKRLVALSSTVAFSFRRETRVDHCTLPFHPPRPTPKNRPTWVVERLN